MHYARRISDQLTREEYIHVKIRKTDPAAMRPVPTVVRRALSPRAQARLAQYEVLRKSVISRLDGPDDVFEVRLEPGEKAVTIRQRLLKVAADANVEIAVRNRGDHLLVGLMTPERRSRRGRRPKSEAGA
jgi:hypothetical protein